MHTHQFLPAFEIRQAVLFAMHAHVVGGNICKTTCDGEGKAIRCRVRNARGGLRSIPMPFFKLVPKVLS